MDTSTIIPIKKNNKPVLSTLQKKFNSLKKKIKALQHELEKTNTTLEQALLFFQKEVLPQKRALFNAISDIIKIFYSHYKNSKRLSKKNRTVLKNLITSKCYEIHDLDDTNDISSEVQDIFKDLNGISYHDLLKDELEQGKAMVSAMFDEFDLDIDLSSLDASDTREAILDKILYSASEATKKHRAETPSLTKPKSKKQIQKENKAEELKKLQQEGMGKIFKELARALHPDLEQDQTIKIEKEELMKRLTTAYENEDLHTILSIEMEWLARTESDEKNGKAQSDEQLKIFNSLLNDQVKELQRAIVHAPFHPRFFSIQNIALYDVSSIFIQLRSMRKNLKEDIQSFKELAKDLTSPEKDAILIDILQHC